MRANSLAYELAQLGHKASLIRIGSAPTLIAMEKGSEGKLNGNYYDYGGYHSLIQIIVEENGEDVPYLLDPQFMDKPIKREQYFIQTMGQNCLEEEDVSQRKVRSSLNCYYSTFEQNQMSGSTPHANQVLENPLYACGWYFDIEFLKRSLSKSNESPTNKTTLVIESLNSEVPSSLKGSTVGHNTSKQLILEAYQSHRDHILEKIRQAESQLSMAEAQLENTSPFYDADPEYEISFNTQLLEQLRKDLEDLEEKKREIRENLGI